MTKIVLEKNKPLYSDLVNNKEVFDEAFPEKDLLIYDFTDNSDYSNFQSIDDLLEREFTDDDLKKSYVVRVPINYVWSSEKTKRGFDRTLETHTKNKAANIEHLSALNKDGQSKGYVESDAAMLSGVLRPNKNGTKWQLVKFIGNNRIIMKLIANNGKVTDVLILITFHEIGKTQEEYVEFEAERHSTDAGDRSGQNESQKFSTVYRANRKKAVEVFNFLSKVKLNYDNIMQLESVEGSDDWLTLSSLSGIKDGIGNGFFKKFGQSNVEASIDTIQKIAEITGEKTIGSSPIECLSMMFKYFTEFGKSKSSVEMMFSKEELDLFFVEYYKKKHTPSMFSTKKTALRLKDLNASGSLKSMPLVAVNKFWPALPGYWSYIRNKETAFTEGSWAMKKFLEWESDMIVKGAILNKLNEAKG